MLQQENMPAESKCLMCGRVQRKAPGHTGGWNMADLRLDAERLYYGHASTGKAIFSIPVRDIDAEDRISTYAMGPHGDAEAGAGEGEAVYFDIRCGGTSEIAGRAFSFRASSALGAQEWADAITRHINNAKDAKLSAGELYRRWLARFYWFFPVQVFFVGLIIGSFACDVAEAELMPEENSDTQKTFDTLDIFFNIAFIGELILNMGAHWFTEFWRSYWNILDFAIVMSSVVSMLFSGVPLVKVLRIFRAFRIVRVFKRLKALRIIIAAMVQSFKPVVNAFLILILATAVYAIVAVKFFAGLDAELFGSFSKAFFTMFQCMTGLNCVY